MCKAFPTRRKGDLWDRGLFGNGRSSQSQNGAFGVSACFVSRELLLEGSTGLQSWQCLNLMQECPECHRDLPAQPPVDLVTLDKSLQHPELVCFYCCTSTYGLLNVLSLKVSHQF